MSNPLRFDIDFTDLGIEEVEAYLQEGGRGTAEYAASCNTILPDAENTTIINGSCGRGNPGGPAPDTNAIDEVLADF
ncbi:MAG: hypothetical protein AAF752_03270 [Bacteroidota bacterium]